MMAAGVLRVGASPEEGAGCWDPLASRVSTFQLGPLPTPPEGEPQASPEIPCGGSPARQGLLLGLSAKKTLPRKQNLNFLLCE